MKRIIIFIGLKIAELSILVFIPFGLGMVAHKYNLAFSEASTNLLGIWFTGFANIVFFAIMPLGILIVLGLIISLNWDWAGKLSKRKPKR